MVPAGAKRFTPFRARKSPNRLHRSSVKTPSASPPPSATRPPRPPLSIMHYRCEPVCTGAISVRKGGCRTRRSWSGPSGIKVRRAAARGDSRLGQPNRRPNPLGSAATRPRHGWWRAPAGPWLMSRSRKQPGRQVSSALHALRDVLFHAQDLRNRLCITLGAEMAASLSLGWGLVGTSGYAARVCVPAVSQTRPRVCSRSPAATRAGRDVRGRRRHPPRLRRYHARWQTRRSGRLDRLQQFPARRARHPGHPTRQARAPGEAARPHRRRGLGIGQTRAGGGGQARQRLPGRYVPGHIRMRGLIAAVRSGGS